MRLQRRLALVLIAACVGGCLPVAGPTPGSTLTPSSGTSFRPALTPPSTSAVPTGPPSAAIAAGCPVPPGSPSLPNLADPAVTPQTLLAFLNAGGAPAALPGLLDAAGRAGRPAETTLSLDLNSDARLDLAVAVLDPTSPQSSRRAPFAFFRPVVQSTPRGSLLVFLCQGDHYVLGEPMPTEADRAPILHAGSDLTGDQIDDLLVGWQTCGAHTCFERFEVVSASGPQVLRRALEPSDDLPYPEVTRAAGGSVAITATGIASVGAGPFRRLTRSWEWEPIDQSFRLASEQSEPPRYRIHVVLDADAAVRAGNLQEALDLYHRVALDDSLLDWVDPTAERANLTGYSMFRVVLTYLQMNDLGDAGKAYGILQNQYASGSSGQAYAAMAQAFWEASTATDSYEQGCQAAQAFAEAHTDEVITPLYFGYANPTYAPIDLCPISSP